MLETALIDLLMDLPEESEEAWQQDGNWTRKMDLVFTDNLHSEIVEKRLMDPAILPLYVLKQYNVVTDFYDDNSGWEVNISDSGEVTVGTP